jgi:hypothetical protein
LISFSPMGLSREDAMRILGLEADASATEIDDRFHRLARETHPDQGGNTDDFRRVLEARDRLRLEAPSSDLVRARGSDLQAAQPVDLVTLERERDTYKRHREKSEQVTKGLVRAQVNRLTRGRRRANFVAWLGGGAGAVTLAVRATGSTAEDYVEIPWVAPVLILSIFISVTCAAVGFVISGRTTRIEQAIEDAAETMSDRSVYLDLFYEFVDELGNHTSWISGEIEEAVEWWSKRYSGRGSLNFGADGSAPVLRRLATWASQFTSRTITWLSGGTEANPTLADLAAVIGAGGFTRLLIAKGIENGLLTEVESLDEDRLLIEYRLVLDAAARQI